MLTRKANNKPLKKRNRVVGLPTVAKHLSDVAEHGKYSAKSGGKYLAEVGKQGENIATRFLSRKGYRVLGKNVKTFVGEIDLVVKKENYIIFVEVKTRKSLSFGPPYQSVTERKKKKLVQCALCYLKMKDIFNVPWQIDVVSIEIKRIFCFINKVKIEHFEDAIEE